MNKKIQSFFSKFKFKWWSWELDAVKIVPAILMLLAFLPVLPHEKKDGKLISVLGVEASVNNFYEIGWRKVFATEAEGEEILKGEAFYELDKLYEIAITNTRKHKEYLMKKGIPIEKASCIIMRDFFLYNYFMDNDAKVILNKYPPSPVPAVWMIRIPFKYLLELISTTSIRFEDFNTLVDKCSKFKNMAPPTGYLEDDFSYEK